MRTFWGFTAAIVAAILCCFPVNNVSAFECPSADVAGAEFTFKCPRLLDSSDKQYCCGASCCTATEQAQYELERTGKTVLDTVGVDSSDLSTEVIVAIGVGAVLLVIILITVCCCCCPCCCCYKRRVNGAVYRPAAKI